MACLTRCLHRNRRFADGGDAGNRTSAKGDPDGLDPTRYGDWESKGIAID
ncbi:DUF1674 domain-containing protein, partial [Sphingomonas sp. DC1200-1]